MRPATAKDVDEVLALARAAGAGLTNLPPDRDSIEARLAGTTAALTDEAARTAGASIVLVLELARGPRQGQIVGTSCIFPKVGVNWPFYSYRLTRLANASRELDKRVAHDVLVLANDFDGSSEVGGLFVSSALRASGAGRLAARSRYMFMAAHRDWFGGQVISELRGYVDADGRSPFWESLGRHFYEMSYEAADRFNGVSGNQFIADLGPRHPIYTRLLSDAAREAIGRPHDDGRRALALLEHEGFRFQGYVDIFDAGPTLSADFGSLRAVRELRSGPYGGTRQSPPGEAHIVAVGFACDFRAAVGRVAECDDGAVILEPSLAEALGPTPGDCVRYAPF